MELELPIHSSEELLYPIQKEQLSLAVLFQHADHLPGSLALNPSKPHRC
ncbi:hypothetical protein EMIT0P171_40242 [Pseudomonas sp. IT-P171]